MKILIIEDEALAAEKLKKVLLEINSQIEILDTLVSVEESIQWLKENKEPHIIISDIHLADGLCFSIFSEVKINCPIIFATAYDKYAIQAFEVNSIDYLLKPVIKERLEQALKKYETLNQTVDTNRESLFEEFKTLLSSTTKEYKTRFLCKLGNKIKSVAVDQISYFYTEDKMTFILDKSKTRYPVNNTLDEIENLINPNHFFRLNRQFITHYDSISEIHPHFKGRVKVKLNPKNESDIVVSTERTPLFKSWLDR